MRRRDWMKLCVAVGAALMLALPGCGEEGDPKPVEPPLPAAVIPKIVTFAPALTQMLRDLKMDDQIVGVGENDDAAPKGLPVVGNFLSPDAEKLVKIKPTHVLMMVGLEGPPARIVELSKSLGFELITYRYPASFWEVGDILAESQTPATEPAVVVLPPSLGKVFKRETQARVLRHSMLERLTRIANAVKSDQEPSVLVVIGTGPLMASGPKTVFDDVLPFAGGRNAAWDSRVPAPTYDREKLLTVKPDVILLVQPNGAPLKSVDEDSRLAELRGLDIPAVKNNRVHLINDPLAMLPSSSLPRVVAAIAKAIHPSRAKAIDEALSSSIVAGKPATAPADPDAANSTNSTDAKPDAGSDDKPAAP